MREAEVRYGMAANAKRAALMFQQFEFLETRSRAWETAYLKIRWFELVRAFFDRAFLLRAVDHYQMQFLKDGKAKMEELAKKPKLTVVGANGVH